INRSCAAGSFALSSCISAATCSGVQVGSAELRLAVNSTTTLASDSPRDDAVSGRGACKQSKPKGLAKSAGGEINKTLEGELFTEKKSHDLKGYEKKCTPWLQQSVAKPA